MRVEVGMIGRSMRNILHIFLASKELYVINLILLL